ncbi:MAG TPA: four helix bundle protein [Terriglobales bacterium]|nr:four helix bundle protein [Terriglobales bacterium]
MAHCSGRRVKVTSALLSSGGIMARHYKDLAAWQKSMNLVELVYLATAVFPRHETYGLASQMRRAAVSVPSNIAEGQSRFFETRFSALPASVAWLPRGT